MTMINELMGWDFSFGMMRFGGNWKRHRKMFSNHFRPSNIPTYHHVLRACSHDLLNDLIESPGDLKNHLRHVVTKSTTQIMYGMTVAKRDDHYKSVAENAFEAMTNAASPGAFLVDVFPLLRHVPAWFPGAGFRRKAREWKKLTAEMVDMPYSAAQEAMMNGNASSCFVTNVTKQLEISGIHKEEYQVLRNCAGLGFAAGVQTTSNSLLSLFLAMMLYPSSQRRAQEDLDRVCVGRLPDFRDRPLLPYIDALCVELTRWGIVSPLGVPHMATKDDIYNGYFIPAGTLVIGNIWAMAHNETTYPEPFEFKPERFLSRDGRTCFVSGPSTEAFGFGRRKCAGRFLADAQLFITVASILKVFRIETSPETPNSRPAYEDLFTCGMESHPVPFKCSITPRRKNAVDLVKRDL